MESDENLHKQIKDELEYLDKEFKCTCKLDTDCYNYYKRPFEPYWFKQRYQC